MSKENKYYTVCEGKATPTYVSYNSMKQRCLYKKHKKYRYYGGIGIAVCERWINSYSAFVDDMGLRPDNTSLDRINPSGNYEPNNCRWVDKKTQNLNRKNTLTVEYKKREFSVSSLSSATGVPVYNIYKWIKNDYDLQVMVDRYLLNDNLHNGKNKDKFSRVSKGC